MEKTCVFLGLKRGTFKNKETGELIEFTRLHVWDNKDFIASAYPFPNAEDAGGAELGDTVIVTLHEATKYGTSEAILKASKCVLA